MVLEQHAKYALCVLLYNGLAAKARSAHAQACDCNENRSLRAKKADHNTVAVVLKHHVKYALCVLLCLSLEPSKECPCISMRL